MAQRFAVLGAGAIGTWVGAAAAEAGAAVTLIARGAHLEALRAQGGARLRSADGERLVPVAAEGDPAGVGPVDVVFVAVKAHDLPVAAPAATALLGPDTVVVAAQNGVPWWYPHGLTPPDARRPMPKDESLHPVGHPSSLGADPAPDRIVQAVDPGGAVSAALPPERVLGLVVYLGARIAAPGIVETRPEAGLILGEPDGSDSPRLRAVAGLLESAGFPVRRTSAIRTETWTKLMGNGTLNLISVLTRAGLGTMVGDPRVRPLIRQAMAEVMEIAAADGARPRISIDERLAITGRLGDHKTSTLQDLEAGKRLELDALGAAVLELADQAGVATPTLRTLYALADLQARTLGLR